MARTVVDVVHCYWCCCWCSSGWNRLQKHSLKRLNSTNPQTGEIQDHCYPLQKWFTNKDHSQNKACNSLQGLKERPRGTFMQYSWVHHQENGEQQWCAWQSNIYSLLKITWPSQKAIEKNADGWDQNGARCFKREHYVWRKINTVKHGGLILSFTQWHQSCQWR